MLNLCEPNICVNYQFSKKLIQWPNAETKRTFFSPIRGFHNVRTEISQAFTGFFKTNFLTVFQDRYWHQKFSLKPNFLYNQVKIHVKRIKLLDIRNSRLLFRIFIKLCKIQSILCPWSPKRISRNSLIFKEETL